MTAALLGRLLRTVLIVAAIMSAGRAFARESEPVHSARSTATLVSDRDSVNGSVRLALRLRLAPGWHTYWQNPGDAGLPPQLDWQIEPGVTVSAIDWPVPSRQVEGPLTTFGYEGEVLFPVTATLPAGKALALTLHAAWLSCEKICVPEEGTFHLALPAGDGAPAAQEAPLFRAADGAAPRATSWPVRLASDGSLYVMDASLTPGGVKGASFMAADPDRVGASAEPAAQFTPAGLRLDLHAKSPGTPLPGLLVVHDVTGEDTAFAVVASPGPIPDPLPQPPAETTANPDVGPPHPRFLRSVALALAGGLLLNLMPCVFPVLAMKAAGLAALSGIARSAARLQSLAYAVGAVGAFCAIGGVLAALRAAGSQAGWGYQFQNPVFVVLMGWLVFVLGLNFSGVFVLGGGRLSGVGQGLAGRSGLIGSLATGALAVLVASPCTAPFMGAALAAALTSPPIKTVAIFGALGGGLALPSLAIAFVPGARHLLPRPGMWMERLRQGLAFPLYATAAWLVWVLAQQSGADGVLVAAGGCVALGFAFWLLGGAQRAGHGGLAVAGGVAAVAAAVAGAILLVSEAPSVSVSDAAQPTRFSISRLASLRAEGRPVLVDMTAAWCVTCLVNERVALDRPEVRAALDRARVVLLRGDWTRPDAEIAAFLRENGRDGVPLYVFYPQGGGAPRLLPQILTPGIVLDAVGAAT